MTELPAILQYGAMGMLALVLLGIYRLADKFAKAFLTGFMELVEAMKGVSPELRNVKTEVIELKNHMSSLRDVMKDCGLRRVGT
jgi:hypothetical protein